MDSPQRPLPGEALSTPPITPVTSISEPHLHEGPPLGNLTNILASSLTPPTSPQQSLKAPSTGLGLDLTVSDSYELPHNHTKDSLAENVDALSGPEAPSAVAFGCPFVVEIPRDLNSREQVYGTGAWSIVLKGIVHNKATSTNSMPTPPSSPITTVPQLVAVKRPLHRNAILILKSEAIILSRIATTEGSSSHVIQFYGMIPGTDSLVLAAMPLSLEVYIGRCAIEARARQTTWTMSEPVLGNSKAWLGLASRLVEGLAWLHTKARIIHGDIKPGNILLSPIRDTFSHFPFKPLFADFSSGQFLDSDAITPNTLSAVTREYTAPELLSYAVLSNPNSTATTASDVFSLAVTLLVAATGELLVYGGSVWQRQAMATQGWYILSNVRNGDQGVRVPRHGIVEQVLERSVLKAGMGRIDAQSWVALVRDKMRGIPGKKL